MAKLTISDRFKQTIQWIIDHQNFLDSRYMTETSFYEQLHSFTAYVNAFKYFFCKKQYKKDVEEQKHHRELQKRFLDKTEDEYEFKSHLSASTSLEVLYDSNSHHKDINFEQPLQNIDHRSLIGNSSDDSVSEKEVEEGKLLRLDNHSEEPLQISVDETITKYTEESACSANTCAVVLHDISPPQRCEDSNKECEDEQTVIPFNFLTPYRKTQQFLFKLPDMSLSNNDLVGATTPKSFQSFSADELENAMASIPEIDFVLKPEDMDIDENINRLRQKLGFRKLIKENRQDDQQ